jgi:hypothetical protein
LNHFSTTHSVTTANGEKIEAIGKGTVEIEAAVGGRWNKITLTDVWCVPSIQKNLFSVLAAQDNVKTASSSQPQKLAISKSTD